MTVISWLLSLVAATLQASPLNGGEVLSNNVVWADKRASAVFSCENEKVIFRLTWPIRIEKPYLNVGIGSGSGMDAAMGPAEPWTILKDPDRRTAIAPSPASKVVDSIGGDTLLLLSVEHGDDSVTAEFEAHLIKAAFVKAGEHCY